VLYQLSYASEPATALSDAPSRHELLRRPIPEASTGHASSSLLQRREFAATHLLQPPQTFSCDRAGDGARTRDIKLGRLALYQLSYSRDTALAPRFAAPRPLRGCPANPRGSNGGGRIRTYEGRSRQIYSLLRLATSVPHPGRAPLSELTARIELATARLQIGCSAN
jgi:hypothetical protein